MFRKNVGVMPLAIAAALASTSPSHGDTVKIRCHIFGQTVTASPIPIGEKIPLNLATGETFFNIENSGGQTTIVIPPATKGKLVGFGDDIISFSYDIGEYTATYNVDRFTGAFSVVSLTATSQVESAKIGVCGVMDENKRKF